MPKYRVQTDSVSSDEFDDYESAVSLFERWKDNKMADGVVADESFVEIAESDDDFEDHKIITKVVAVIDNDTGLGSPREEGIDWDYWAKWQKVKED